MDQKFFVIPFAAEGDRVEIPNATQGNGSVSYTQGYGFDYERDLAVDLDAKPIEREQMNDAFFQLTRSLGAIQGAGAPEFITSADNGGAPFQYGRGAIVRWRLNTETPFRTYVSRVDNNTAAPSNATNWAILTFEIATQAQAEVGTDNGTVMSPLRVAQAIAASSVSIPDASHTVTGIVRLATQAEANAGTNHGIAVTPFGMASYVTTASPVATTAVVGRTRYATAAEANAGTLNTVAVTPSGMASHVAAAVPQATTAVVGRTRYATLAEHTGGTSQALAATPAGVAQQVGLRLLRTNNLSDLANAATARTNLELGTAAVVNTGTSAANVPTTAQADGRYIQFGQFGIGGLSSTLTVINLTDNSIGNGRWSFASDATGAPSGLTGNSHLFHSRRAAGGGEIQIAVNELTGRLFSRGRQAAGWTAFREMADVNGQTFTGGISAPTITTTSDERLKRDITALVPRDLAATLELFTFVWRESEETDLGVIAQRVREVAPEYVHEDGNGMLSVDKAGLALEAVLGLAARVAALEAQQ